MTWPLNVRPMRGWLALLAVCLTPALAGDDLTLLSLQDLLRVPVTSVSKRKQPLSRTAAAVYVITQEDIRRSVATCLPELLRMVPGLHVARIDANKWAVGARGFSGRYSDKLLVLVDGRSVYTQPFSGVYWEALDLPLEDIERIEIIRGPGAAVWGANAVNGVINIITKPARDTRGPLVSVQTGTSDRAVGTLRYGGALGSKFGYRTYVRGGLRAPNSTPTGQSAQDGWDSLRGGFRADGESARGDRYMLQAEGYGMEADYRAVRLARTKPYQSDFMGTIRMSGASGQFRWERPLSETSNLSLESSVSTASRDEEMGVLSNRVVSLDVQHGSRPGSRQQFTWGLGFRRSMNDFNSERVHAVAVSRTLDVLSLFAEDEFELVREKLYLTVGAKLERHTYTDWGFQPRVQVSVPFHPRQLAWLSAARALRTPSRYERDLVGLDVGYMGNVFGLPLFANFAGDPNMRTEVLDALEAGYRLQVTHAISVDVAGFVNRYHRLREAGTVGSPRMEVGPGGAALVIPVALSDLGRGTERGGEVAVTWMPVSRWKLNASYSHTTPHIPVVTPGGTAVASEFAYPRNQTSGRSFLDLPKRFSLDASYYYVSPVTAGLADGTPVPLAPGFRGDLRLARRFGNGLELMVCADHLFGPARVEYVPGVFTDGNRIGRSYHLRLLWRPRD